MEIDSNITSKNLEKHLNGLSLASEQLEVEPHWLAKSKSARSWNNIIASAVRDLYYAVAEIVNWNEYPEIKVVSNGAVTPLTPQQVYTRLNQPARN